MLTIGGYADRKSSDSRCRYDFKSSVSNRGARLWPKVKVLTFFGFRNQRYFEMNAATLGCMSRRHFPPLKTP